MAVVDTLTRRAINICSTLEFKNEELELLQEVFVANGYPRDEVKDIIERTQQKVYQEQFDKVMNSEQFEERKRLKEQEQDEIIKVTVPFPGNQKAGKMKRIARKHGVALSFSNKNTIKQGLVKLKQKT
jgi:hypothetical protein